jgi:NitT/TauT family transport system substrate-binding protein
MHARPRPPLRLAGWLLTLVLACAPAGTSSPAAPPAPSEASPAAAATAAPARIPVRIGYSAISGANLGLWVAKEAGLFEQYGLEVVDFPLVEGGTLAIQALVAGDIQIVSAGSSGVIAAVLGGSDIVMIAGSSNKFDFALMTVPEIQSAADLRGKRVGVSRFGSSSDFAARVALMHLGLDPDRDVTLIQAGGTGQRLAAMQSGALDAATEIDPALLTAQKLGFRILVDLAELGVPYEAGPMSTTRALIAQNPEIPRRFIRAYLAGIHRMKTDRAFGIETVRRYMHTDDPEVAAATWEHFALRSIPEVPYLLDAALNTVLQELAPRDPRAANARPEQFYDNSFLQEAEASGFVRQLYGR